MYLLCMLDSESYSDPHFFGFFETEGDAKYKIPPIDDNTTIEWDSDTRCTAIYSESFDVYQILEVNDNAKYILVHHHAFDGVDFDIVDCFDNRFEAKKRMTQEAFDFYNQIPEGEGSFEWLTDTQACVDTGVEWNIWTIVKRKEGSNEPRSEEGFWEITTIPGPNTNN